MTDEFTYAMFNMLKDVMDIPMSNNGKIKLLKDLESIWEVNKPKETIPAIKAIDDKPLLFDTKDKALDCRNNCARWAIEHYMTFVPLYIYYEYAGVAYDSDYYTTNKGWNLKEFEPAEITEHGNEGWEIKLPKPHYEEAN